MKGLRKFTVLVPLHLSIVAHVTADPPTLPFRLHEHLIVVKGAANEVPDLNLVIDTGATRTLISSGLCRKLRIPTGRKSVVSWGREVPLKTGTLRQVRIGNAVFEEVEVRVADLKLVRGLKIDLLVGLDLLRRSDVTIDYEKRVLILGPAMKLPHEAPFYPNLPFVLFRLKVREEPLVLILDTGAPYLVLFKGEIEDRIQVLATAERERIAHVAGALTLRKALMPDTFLGGASLGTIPVYLMNGSGEQYGGAAGICSPQTLKLRKLQLNFTRSCIGWER